MRYQSAADLRDDLKRIASLALAGNERLRYANANRWGLSKKNAGYTNMTQAMKGRFRKEKGMSHFLETNGALSLSKRSLLFGGTDVWNFEMDPPAYLVRNASCSRSWTLADVRR